MSEKPFILISNDDGINAPGIKHLWKSLYETNEIAIVAPHREKSGMGLATSLLRPLHSFDVKWENNTPAWKITGTPTDSVKIALSALLEKTPDIVVAGINKGSNAGTTVLYSGTVACAIEATLRNIPGIAFSCYDFDNPNYQICEKYISHIVDHILKNPMPKGTLLNVTFPSKNLEIKGFKMARQGKGRWIESPDKRKHPEGHYYFWLELEHQKLDIENDESDIALLQQGYITAVPIKVNELTNHDYLKEAKDNFENIFHKI